MAWRWVMVMPSAGLLPHGPKRARADAEMSARINARTQRHTSPFGYAVVGGKCLYGLVFIGHTNTDQTYQGGLATLQWPTAGTHYQPIHATYS